MLLTMKASRKSMFPREVNSPLKLLYCRHRQVEVDALGNTPIFQALVKLTWEVENKFHGLVQSSSLPHL